MRNLSATLTAAQKTLSYTPIWKVVFTRSGQATKTYTGTRVLGITHTETPSSSKAEIILHNADGALTALDFEHYQAVISYGMTTSGGDEYSATAPLRVRVQEFHSGMGILRCILRSISILDQLAEDKSLKDYTQEADDTNTIKTLIDAVAAGGSGLNGAYAGYDAVTITYDAGYDDGIINSFIPADYFAISTNESRLDKIDELLGYTSCKRRVEADGAIHIFDPTTTGTTYDYEYKFNVAGDHTFWNKTIRLRFVNPNKEIVESGEGHEPFYRSSATSATSYALAPKVHTTKRRLASDIEAGAIAGAKIETYELDDERGFATVPMNVGQELWDYVKVTDSRQGDTRVGNIQYLQRNVKIPLGSEGMTFNMTLSFGKVAPESMLANMLTTGDGRLSNAQILDMITALDTNIENNRNALNELITIWNSFKLGEVTIPTTFVARRLKVTHRLQIPVGKDMFD